VSNQAQFGIIALGGALAIAGLFAGGFIRVLFACTDGYGRDVDTAICQPGLRQGFEVLEWVLWAACGGSLAGAVQAARTGAYIWLWLGILVSLVAIGLLVLIATGQGTTLQ
jgi:hypothetical protein